MKHRRAFVVLALTALALACFTWAPLHPWDDEAVVIQREADGEWLRQGPSELRLAARAAYTSTALESTRSTYVPPNSDAGRPALAERIWIINLSDSALTQAFGLYLQEALLERPELTEVAYLPAHDMPIGVHRPPDLWVTLRQVERDELHLPGGFRLAANIDVHVARRPFESSWCDESERHGPSLWARLTLNERSFGLISRAARYDEALPGLAGQLDLGEVLDDWMAASGAPIPERWADPSPPAPDDIPLIDLPGAQLVMSQAPPPASSEQTWIVPAGDDLVDRVEFARDALAGAGWLIVDEQRKVEGHTRSFGARREGRLIQVEEPMHFEAVNDDPDERWIVVQHQARPALDELRAWLEARAGEPDPDGALSSLLQSLQAETRAALAESCAQQPIPGLTADQLEALGGS